MIKDLLSKKNKIDQNKKSNVIGTIIFLIQKISSISIFTVACIFVTSAVVGLISSAIETITARNTPQKIYEGFGLEEQNFDGLVEIKGNETDGYYLAFKDGVAEKFEEIDKAITDKAGLYGINDVELFKKMVKAELVTQFPDLGGTVDENDSNQFQGAIKVRRISPNKNIGEVKNTGTGDSSTGDIIYTQNDEGDLSDQSYVLSLSAEHSTDKPGNRSIEEDLKAEEMNVTVAEYVRQLLSAYPQISVNQIGSTSENRNVSEVGRLQTAIDNGADMIVGIDFNATKNAEELEDENGVTIQYNTSGTTENDTVITGASNQKSHDLGEKLKVNVATKMGLDIGEDESKPSDTIGYGNNPDIPSVIVKGGYLTGDKDYDVLKEEDALVDFAKGIVDGILEYWSIPYNGYGTISTEQDTVTQDIESHVRDLSYVPESRFDELLNSGDSKVLEVYTLDENFNIITASWKYDNGTITFERNSPKSYRDILENYTMPFEYLLFLLIDTGRKDFVDALADEVLKAEFILAVEDNVTTTKTDYNEYTKTYEGYRYSDDSDEGLRNIHEITGWNNTVSNQNIQEVCSTKIEITYANTWCVEYAKDLTFNSSELGEESGARIDKIINVNGTVTSTPNHQESSTPGEYALSYTQRVPAASPDDPPVFIYYYQRTETKQVTDTLTISNSYNTGSNPEITGKNRDTSPFVRLYNSMEMKGAINQIKLIQIIESNDKTANMSDLTKYLIYLATGTSIDDVKSFPEDEFNMGSFSGTTGIYGNSVEEKVWFGLRSAGYSEYAVAGVMGNIYQECRFNPSSIQTGVDNADWKGIGLIQWTSGRKQGLKNYAESKGTTWEDVTTQIEYLIGELQRGGGANGYATWQWDGFVTYENQWTNATSATDAARAFCLGFERAGNAMMEVRTSKAEEYYAAFQGRTAPSGDDRIGDITLTGDNATKMMNMLVEAVRIADDDRYTYSQSNRDGEFQYDCSSLVSRLYRQYFGITTPSTTRGYPDIPQYCVGSPGEVQLQPGDVLWRSGHVEIYLGNNMRVGAHTDKVAAPDQISVESYTPPGSFTKVYRFVQ